MIKEALPEGWEKVKLGEICQIIRGASPRPMGDPLYFTGNIPFLKIADITRVSGKVVFESKTMVNALGAEKSRLLKKGTLVLTNSASVCIPKFLGSDACIHDGFVSFINFKRETDLNFLYYYFDYMRPSVIQNNRQGITQVNLNTDIIRDFDLLFPPPSQQHQIVEKIEELFSELDKGIENLKTAQQQLKVYRQAVLKWAFEGRLTNEDVKDGELPVGWEWVKLGDVADVNPKLPNKEVLLDTSEVQFIPMKLVEEVNGKVHLTETRNFGEVKKGYTSFINKDVIFAKVTPCMENGKIAVVDNLINDIGFGSTEFHVIRSKGKAKSQYLFNFLVQERFRNEAENEMTGAVGLRRVPKQFIENYNLPLPTIQEQQQIVQEIESRLSVCDKIEETISTSLQQAEALRQSILKKAFEGKLLMKIALEFI